MIFGKKKHDLNLYKTLLLLSRNIFFYEKLNLDDNFETRIYLMFTHFSIMLKVSKNKGKFHFIEERLGFYWVGDDNFDDPKRILLNIDNMKKTIISEFINLYGGDPWWPSYTSGIAFFNLGQNKDSLKYFFKVVFSQSPLKSKLKSLFYIAKILLKKRFKNEE